MPNPNKIEKVQNIIQELEGVKGFYLADFTGINVNLINQLRATLRKSDIKMKVVKNKLIEKAFQNKNIKNLNEYFNGPTAIIYSKKDIVSPVKIISNFTKEYKLLNVKVGYIEGSIVKKDDVDKIANLPPKEVLMSQILGGMKAPISGFVCTLQELIRKFVATIDAIKEKKASN